MPYLYQGLNNIGFPGQATRNLGFGPIGGDSRLPLFNWKDKRILLVEDEELNMLYLKTILAPTEVALIGAYSGSELRSNFDQLSTFSLVLLDIRLPDSSGWDLIKEIKSLCPTLPVIIQTAYAMSSDKQKSLESGCDDYITKPINKLSLLEMISKYI
ncbi:MAG: response regulator [Bacteroidota bacterium]